METLSPEIKKVRLFHEILECNIVDQGFSPDEAHKITSEVEQKILDKGDKK